MFEFISGLSGLNKNNFINGNDSYLEYKDIYQKKKLYDSDGKSFNLNGTRQNAIIKNDILVTNTSETIEEIGISSIYLGNIVKYLNSFCFAIRSRTNLVFCEYINYLFGNFNFRKKIIKIGQGSTRFNMSKKEFSNILFSYGSLQKQQKIAKFFSLLDKQIELWQTKLQLNELLKKFYLNNLYVLNENALYLPKLRFKYFFGEWKVKKIKNIFIIKSGYGFPIIYQSLFSSNIPFFKVSDISKSSTIKLQSSIFEIHKDEIKLLKYKLFTKESIVFAKIGESCKLNKKRIIKSNNYLFDNNVAGLFNKTNNNFIFLFYKINLIDFNIFVQNGSLPSISFSSLLEFKIYVPELKEQEKIANFLLIIEKKIDLIVEKINILKKQKKYFFNFIFI